jgi:signal transduction histidine kinase
MQLNNAIKFTNKGDTININIKKENNNGIVGIIVNIMDRGLGIDSKISKAIYKIWYKFTWRQNRIRFVPL